MTLYHGSGAAVPRPDTAHSRDRVDFGRGFYATPLLKQAARWARRFPARDAAARAVVSVYACDEAAFARLRRLEFPGYTADWLDFVVACRAGRDPGGYDVVCGGVADDRVFNTCELFLDGLIDRETALGRLRAETPSAQVCFKNQAALDACLTYEGSVTP